MKQPIYIRCPRCELNYIQKKDKLCNVCKNETDTSGEIFDFDLEFDICPICKTNYINGEENICAACAKEKALEAAANGESDTDWKSFVTDADDEEEIDETEALTIGDFDDDDDDDLAIPAIIEEDLEEELGEDDEIEDEDLVDIDDFDDDLDDDSDFGEDD